MFTVMMEIGGYSYPYGKYETRDKANEVAIKVRDERGVETYVDHDEPQKNETVELIKVMRDLANEQKIYYEGEVRACDELLKTIEMGSDCDD